MKIREEDINNAKFITRDNDQAGFATDLFQGIAIHVGKYILQCIPGSNCLPVPIGCPLPDGELRIRIILQYIPVPVQAFQGAEAGGTYRDNGASRFNGVAQGGDDALHPAVGPGDVQLCLGETAGVEGRGHVDLSIGAVESHLLPLGHAHGDQQPGLDAWRAVVALDSFLRTEPRHAGALYNRGLALRQLGREEDAQASLGAALEAPAFDCMIMPNEVIEIGSSITGLIDAVLVERGDYVEAGEVVGVIGPSGSGKSTLLNIIGALDKPTSGSVVLAGQELSDLSDTELAKIRNEQIGFVDIRRPRRPVGQGTMVRTDRLDRVLHRLQRPFDADLAGQVFG